jgi:nitroreductase
MSTPAPVEKARPANETLTTIQRRRSIRAFDPRPLPAEDLQLILEAVRQAPSAANRQPLHFVVVRDPDQKRRVSTAAANQHWLADADVIVLVVGFPAQSQRWYVVDAAIALQTMVLAATSLGYGTCWIGAFNEEMIKEAVGLPAESRIVALSPIGWPAEQPDARPRKSAEQLFSFDRYGQV